MNKLLPCCLYPNTTVLIDDDAPLTKWLTLKLQPFGPVIVFNDPKEALAYLKNYIPSTFLTRMDLDNFSLAHLEQERLFSDHRNEIFCIIIDYAMPGLNGLELAEALTDFPAKKLMLTGEADHTLAVEAFNETVIDQFILKSTDNLMDVLVNSVVDLKWQRFSELSESVKAAIEEPISSLLDHAFAKHFLEYLNETMLTEFYLENEYGDLLLVNESGAFSHYYVREEKKIASLALLAESLYAQDPDDDRSMLDGIVARTTIPFLPVDFDLDNSSLREWKPYCYDFKVVKGDSQNYYCALK